MSIVGFDVTGNGTIGIWNSGSYVRIEGNHVHHIPAPCTAGVGGAGIDNGVWPPLKYVHDSDITGNVVDHIGIGTFGPGPAS